MGFETTTRISQTHNPGHACYAWYVAHRESKAGFAETRQIFVDPTDFFRLFRFAG
ncbi:MAG TPA: hypothetical protein VF014_07955 [Casimicrobiaceae bacterium]|nr:hypothetical protein [Casimicrobiaceae bacterium]